MPPKTKKNAELKDEQFQAIVLSDSYETRFMPLALEKPRCLLPLANSPLIEYTLEFLATAGVSEVFVICSSHAKQVEGYLKGSKWNDPESTPFTLNTIASPGSQSVGDVMRELDNKGLIRNDFLLISGDIVSNMDFSKVLEAHRARKQKDRNSIMTMVLREASPLHRTRQRADPGIFILDESSQRCLRYEEATSASGSISLDEEILGDLSSLSVRNDLIDCHIDICTPDVPALFQENFDYDNMRSDFVRGILTSDILGKTIYTHVVKENYAARVQSQQTYDAISKDLVSRYAYPIVPDYNLMDDQTYSYQHGHIYKEQEVVLAQSCVIERSTVIGAKTYIGEHTRIGQTVIGRGCQIGNNVLLEGCYVWDDVKIEDNVEIRNAIIANGAIIRAGAKVLPGSIVSFGVVIGSGHVLEPGSLVTTKEVDEDAAYNDDSGELVTKELATDEEVVGKDGLGGRYERDEDEEDAQDGDVEGLVYSMSLANLSGDSVDSQESAEEAIADSAAPGTAGLLKPPKKSRHRRTASAISDISAADSDEEESFLSEAVASIERSITENHTQDVAMLELKTLKMTMNASYEEVREATMTALVAHITRKVNEDSQDVKAATRAIFSAYSTMISKQIFENDDQMDLLLRLQEQCARRPLGSKIFLWAVMELYDDDIVEEDYITEWWESEESSATKTMVAVRTALKPWYEWLMTAEEDSD